MSGFVIFALVLTFVYVVYFAVMITLDLHGKKDEKKSEEETYDVGDMTNEEQPVAIEESGFESDSSISAENDFINDKKVSTHKSLFAIDLLGDFIVLNIPTILCTLDIAKKKKN